MSWCRWSSLDFRCDLYCYESDAGVEVDVASRRHNLSPDAMPDPVDLHTDPDGWAHRHDEVMDLVVNAEHHPIGLPHDNEHRTFGSLSEAADWIDELERLGYVVPAGMTDQMRDADLDVFVDLIEDEADR